MIDQITKIPSCQDMTRQLLLEHFQTYPLLQPEDLFKFLYQSAFGCEHMVTSLDRVVQYIKEEASRLSANDGVIAEPLDGGYCRVHLKALLQGLQAETLGKLFFLSAVHEKNGTQQLKEKLHIATTLVHEGQIAIEATVYDAALKVWMASGCCAIHHSKAFRDAYAPAYRVVSKKLAEFLPLFTILDRHKAENPSPLFLKLCGCTSTQEQTVWAVLERVYEGQVLPSSHQGDRNALSVDISRL